MSGRPKNDIMTPQDMEEIHSRTGRLYSRTADGGEVVSALVEQLAIELATLPKKIDLRDESLIKSVAVAYVNSCVKSGVLPNKSGFCRACGISRRAMDYYLLHHAEERTAELLRIIFDSFAETLNSAGLANAVNPVTGIFLSKALYQYVDTIKIEADQNIEDPLGKRRSVEEILSNYEDLPLPD